MNLKKMIAVILAFLMIPMNVIYTNAKLVDGADEAFIADEVENQFVYVSGQGNTLDFSGWDTVTEFSLGSNFLVGKTQNRTAVAIALKDQVVPDLTLLENLSKLKTNYGVILGVDEYGEVSGVGRSNYNHFETYDWEDVIDIVIGKSETYGLKSDGTIIYTESDTQTDTVEDYHDATADWDDVVDIEGYEDLLAGITESGTLVTNFDIDLDEDSWTSLRQIIVSADCIVGLKADGSVVYQMFDEDDEGEFSVDDWKDIKQIGLVGDTLIGLRYDGNMVDTGDSFYGYEEVDSWTNIESFQVSEYYMVGMKGEESSLTEEETQEEEASVLYDLGLFTGTSTTSFEPDLEDETTREQAIKMIGQALDWSINASDESSFTDVDDWAQPYVAKAVELGVTTGTSSTTFGGDNVVTGHEVATWLLRALGEDSDTSWSNTDLLLRDKDLDILSDDTVYTRGDLVDAIYKTLPKTADGSEKSLILEIVGQDKDMQEIALENGLLEANDLLEHLRIANNIYIAEGLYDNQVLGDYVVRYMEATPMDDAHYSFVSYETKDITMNYTVEETDSGDSMVVLTYDGDEKLPRDYYESNDDTYLMRFHIFVFNLQGYIFGYNDDDTSEFGVVGTTGTVEFTYQYIDLIEDSDIDLFDRMIPAFNVDEIIEITQD